MNQENQEHYTEIMKEVNLAYQSGDLARLLEIERQYQVQKSINLENASNSEIERQCDRLEMDNQLLKNQYENLKSELRWMRRTPEGRMVKQYRSLVRSGFDPIESTICEAERHIEELEKIRNFVADLSRQKISIKEFMRGQNYATRNRDEEMKEMMAELLGYLVMMRLDF